jgi:CRISPR/Cas system-associated exonuclease Cas4 (RecB family)
MLKVTIDSIKDFQTCERLYDYRYRDQSPEKIYSRDILSLKFESTIKNIIYYFWFKKQAGISPSYSSLLNRWEKLWFPKNVNSYDIITEQHESVYGNLSSLTTKATAILLKFHETYSDLDLIPISISDTYVAPINKSVKIEDRIDLIYRKDLENYVVKFIFNYKNNNRHMYQVDFAAMYLAFKTKHPSKVHETSFGYIDLLSSNLNFAEYEVTSEDLDSLEYWCDTMYSKEIFVPRRGLTPYCKKCPFDEPCSKWKFPK